MLFPLNLKFGRLNPTFTPTVMQLVGYRMYINVLKRHSIGSANVPGLVIGWFVNPKVPRHVMLEMYTLWWHMLQWDNW